MVSWESKEKYCQYPRAAVTKDHRLGGLNNSITVLEARSPRSRCQQGWFLLRVEKENLFHAFS